MTLQRVKSSFRRVHILTYLWKYPIKGNKGTALKRMRVMGPLMMDQLEESIMNVKRSIPKSPMKLFLKPRSVRVITSIGKPTLLGRTYWETIHLPHQVTKMKTTMKSSTGFKDPQVVIWR
jgi:hypothetical protein